MDTVSRIKTIQEWCDSVESEKIFLKRSIDRGVIFKRDLKIQAVINEMLSNRFVNKEGVMSFERGMYDAMVKVKIKALEKEMTSLNGVIAKQKRVC